MRMHPWQGVRAGLASQAVRLAVTISREFGWLGQPRTSWEERRVNAQATDVDSFGRIHSMCSNPHACARACARQAERVAAAIRQRHRRRTAVRPARPMSFTSRSRPPRFTCAKHMHSSPVMLRKHTLRTDSHVEPPDKKRHTPAPTRAAAGIEATIVHVLPHSEGRATKSRRLSPRRSAGRAGGGCSEACGARKAPTDTTTVNVERRATQSRRAGAPVCLARV